MKFIGNKFARCIESSGHLVWKKVSHYIERKVSQEVEMTVHPTHEFILAADAIQTDRSDIISTIKDLYNDLLPIEPFNWLNGRNFSDSFVICVGAGPWRFNRRQKVQEEALKKLNGRDLSRVKGDIKWYPFDWQNEVVNYLRDTLVDINRTMEKFCGFLKDQSNYNAVLDYTIRDEFYKACGKPNGSKVLSLFIRDSFKLDCFPIDRHVRRYLKEHRLPINEDQLVDLCKEAGVDPRLFSIGIIKKYGQLDNPDWSVPNKWKTKFQKLNSH